MFEYFEIMKHKMILMHACKTFGHRKEGEINLSIFHWHFMKLNKKLDSRQCNFRPFQQFK